MSSTPAPISEHAITRFNAEGVEEVLYEPLPHQIPFHASNAPNLLALGTRGTGKSKQLRWDAIIRCLMFPNFRALIVRRTMPELRRSHLAYIEHEMMLLTGSARSFLSTTSMAKFPNGSTLVFAHCETEADVLNFLSSEYGFIGFDELSTFTLDQFLKISAAAREPLEAPYKAVVRCGSNPLGPGAEWMYDWFVDKTVDMGDYPDYHPDDFEMQFSRLEDNTTINAKDYAARLSNLPEHVRRAWLYGERVVEGSYFTEFRKTLDTGEPWHAINEVPTIDGVPIYRVPWLSIYRCIDWGYDPDPAVCIWIAVLPDKRAIAFKERHWKRTLAQDVAIDIKRESVGMKIVESFCDPTMNLKEGQIFSIGEIFERNGVPVTAATNDRILFGYSVHEFLNEKINGKPKLQIVKPVGDLGCPDLLKTIPQMRRDKLDPRKLADGNDHWVVAVAYFCMGQAPPSKTEQERKDFPWMRPKLRTRYRAA